MIAAGSFSPVDQDIVRLVVSQYNGCAYCVAAHTGSLQAKGLSKQEIIDIRKGKPADPKQSALVAYTLKIMDTRGFVSDSDIAAFKNAGFTDTHVAEITVLIAQKTISNYFNHIHDTDLDLPRAPEI